MTECTTCDDMGAVEWPESPWPCPDCRPAEFLAELANYEPGSFGPYHKDAVRAARKVLDGEVACINHPPRRDDAVAAWIEARRDIYSRDDISWLALDDLLYQYELHADTGMPLDGTVTEGGPGDE